MIKSKGDGEAIGTHAHQRMQISIRVVAGVLGEIMVSYNFLTAISFTFPFIYMAISYYFIV